MQGHDLPWYPQQGNPPAGYTWEGYPPLHGDLLPPAHPPEGYPNDVYPPPQPQFSERHFSHEALVVNYLPERYSNDVYPPPQPQFSERHFSHEALVVSYPPERYSNDVYPPPEGYSNDVYPPPVQQCIEHLFSPPVGYPNNVYPPPPQQLDELHFYEGMSVQSHTHTHTHTHTLTLTGGGQNNPQIQGVSELRTQGNVNMAPNCGNTIEVHLFGDEVRGNRCQPWTISLTGVLVIASSWLFVPSVVVTMIVLTLISAWWYIFLYIYPKACSDMIAGRRKKVKQWY